jgi:hypothetical protein
MSAREHCAISRANHVFGTDEKHIRTKNMVMDNSKVSAGRLCKIADCVRTASRPRNSATAQQRGAI